MRRPSTIVIVGIVAIGIIVIAVIAGLLHNWLSQPKQTTVSEAQLIESFSKKYPPLESVTKTTIDKYVTYANQWVIADINFVNDANSEDEQHSEEDGHDHTVTGTRCVFALKEQDIETLACSSEGFYASDFPDTVPSELIERADQPL
jgi:hypothetical protein